MYTSLEERAAMLERQLLEMQEELAKRHHLVTLSIFVLVLIFCDPSANTTPCKLQLKTEGDIPCEHSQPGDRGGGRTDLL